MSLCNYYLSLLSSSFAGVGSWRHSWLQVLRHKIRSTSVWSNKSILLGSYLCMVKTIQNYFHNLAHITSFRHTSRDMCYSVVCSEINCSNAYLSWVMSKVTFNAIKCVLLKATFSGYGVDTSWVHHVHLIMSSLPCIPTVTFAIYFWHPPIPPLWTNC